MAKCEAKSKRSGERCRVDAVRGETRCYHHLGKSFAIVKAERDAKAVARRLMPNPEDIRPLEDPLGALNDLAAEALAWKTAVSELVADLKADIRYRSKSGEQLRAEVALFERALDRAAKILVDIGRLDIDSRLASISQEQALRLELVLITVLAKFGVSGRDPEVRQAVAAAIAAQPEVTR